MKQSLVLRTVNADGTSHGGFVWPLEVDAIVEAPDWDAKPECGNGLHGLLWGQGACGLLGWEDGKKALVLAVDSESIIDLDGKVKFPRCEVVAIYDEISAAASHIVKASGVQGAHYSMATAGDYGTATAGDYGTATAGRCGTATAGDYGTATAGRCGTATAGDRGTATAGHNGIIQIKWWAGQRYRITIGYVGEGGIEANKPYQLDDDHKFVLVDAQPGGEDE